MTLSPFGRRVVAAVRRIPGRPLAHRAVGTLMRTVNDPSLPAHRVIAAGGRLGGFGGQPDAKAQRLRSEGVIVISGRIRRFRDIRWPGQRAQGKGHRDGKGQGRKAKG
jgi:alkylated DNA nucleotide flippase Atl1